MGSHGLIKLHLDRGLGLGLASLVLLLFLLLLRFEGRQGRLGWELAQALLEVNLVALSHYQIDGLPLRRRDRSRSRP